MIQVVLIHSHWSFDQRCLGWGHNLWKGARPCAMWRHAQGRWANHFFAFLHFGSNAAQLPPHKRLASTFQPTMKLVIEPASAILLHSLMPPWRFNGPFWNSVWLLVWFPSAATIKWLAWTFQPTIKLVIEPASAILLHSLMPALAFQWATILWNSVWLLVWFPSAATIKWLASTFQPTMKLVVGPAPAMLWGWNCRGSWVFNPITNLKLGWWVEASHLIVARFGKLCK